MRRYSWSLRTGRSPGGAAVSGSNERSLRAHALTFDTGFSGSLKQYRFSVVPTSWMLKLLSTISVSSAVKLLSSTAVAPVTSSCTSCRVPPASCAAEKERIHRALITPRAWGAAMFASRIACRFRMAFSRSCSWSALAVSESRSEVTPQRVVFNREVGRRNQGGVAFAFAEDLGQDANQVAVVLGGIGHKDVVFQQVQKLGGERPA